MSNLETDRTAGTGQTEAKRNPELVRMVVESSAESTVPFQKLPRIVRGKIIDGMTVALTEDELRFRGCWNIKRTEVSKWKIGTIAALHSNPNNEYAPGKDEKLTSTGLRLVHLIVCIADEFNIGFPELLKFVDPVSRVFQRSAEILESGFQNHADIQKHIERSRGTGIVDSGRVRRTGGISTTGNATILRQYKNEAGRRIF